MKQTSENIIVQLASPERKYVKVFHDFLDNSFLTTEEQMIFIVLKSYIDFKEDSGEAYPSMETICKRAKMSEKRARKNINALIKKGIAKKVQRGLTKPNLYTLSDYVTMWDYDNIKDISTVINNNGMKSLTPEEHIAELERMGYKVEIKEKGLETEPTKAQNQALETNNINKNNIKKEKSQESEKYTIDQIHQLFEYDIMVQDYPLQQKEIDSIMSILYTAMNTTKSTIKISGENRPAMAVIGKLMKLHKESIMYAIKQFSEQTERIKNPTAYMLTILYNAPEQFNLDIQNRVSHDMANWNRAEE